MKNLLFLLVLVPSVIFAQSIGADRMFFQPAMEQFVFSKEITKPVYSGDYDARFVLKSFNSTLDKYVTCDIVINYSIKEDGIFNVQNYKIENCAKGFSLISLTKENHDNNLIINIKWNYISPQQKIVKNPSGGREALMMRISSIDDYFVPVDQENTYLNMSKIIIYTDGDTEVISKGGNFFGESGFYKE